MSELKIENAGGAFQAQRDAGGPLDKEKLQRARANIVERMRRDGALCDGLNDKRAIYLIMLRVLELLE